MVISLNCFVLGDTTNRIFATDLGDKVTINNITYDIEELKITNLKKYIWNNNREKLNNITYSDDINLWKVNVSEDALEGVSTEEDVNVKLNGTLMSPNKLFRNKEYFPVNHSFDIENIHIIITVPNYYWILGPNWNDETSIYNWMQQFTLMYGRERLIESFGKDFKYLQRDDTIETLMNGNPLLNGIIERLQSRKQGDKDNHPIPVLAGGPGIGKSRFLDEVEVLLKQYIKKHSDIIICNAGKNIHDESGNIHDVFANMVVINVSYGNESPASDMDVTIGTEASLAIRILFSYFRPRHKCDEFNLPSFRSLCNNSKVSDFTLDVALRVVYTDFMQRNRETTSNPLLVLVLGVDEFNKLYDFNKDVSKQLINSIGGAMCKPPMDIFLIPILSGTVEGLLTRYFSGSMHQSLSLPLHLLDEKDSIKIGMALQLFDDTYVSHHPYFRVGISDIGGHVRTLEYFYQAFSNEWNGNPNKVNIDDVMLAVSSNLSKKYQFLQYAMWLAEPLTKAILGLDVGKHELIGLNDNIAYSYRDLSSMGFVNLVNVKNTTDHYHIRLPYVWVSLFVKYSNHPGMDYWRSMFRYDEPMYWQNFEVFNAKFWALRLSLFHLLGYQEITFKELLRGAKFSHEFPDVKVCLPENIKICKLQHRYPGKTVIADDDTKEDDGIDDDIMEEDDRIDDDNTEDKMEVEYTFNDIFSGHAGYFTKLDYPNKDMRHVFLNADGACWDVFEFMKYSTNDGKLESGNLCLALQVKLANTNANEPLTIDQGSFNKEHTKVTKAMKRVPLEKWALLFLTNVSTKDLSIKTNSNSALVSEKEFLEFYGYTYASRAQFASANEKIYINSVHEDSLKILGFDKNESHEIYLKRQVEKFTDYEDVKTRICISNEKLNKLKRDNRIAF